jgi:RP/EB family microtubule-associated protein
MGRNASSVGMMEGAFFVSRTELLEWVNSLLSVNLQKVEQCASGAIYCQIVDASYPGTVKMNKVNWMARSDHEFIPNYKILQAAFDRNNIEKHIDVDKLIRAKYQDNLELLQWMKALWGREGAGIRDYDAVRARDGRPVPLWANAASTPQRAGTSRVGASGYEKENLSANHNRIASQKSDPAKRRTAPAAAKAVAQRAATPRSGTRPYATTATPSRAPEIENLKATIKEQAEDIDDMRNTLDGLENERDYYFRKLRSVEILCETLKAKMDPSLDVMGIISQVQDILYDDGENDDVQDGRLDAAAASPMDASPTSLPELPAVRSEEEVVARPSNNNI